MLRDRGRPGNGKSAVGPLATRSSSRGLLRVRRLTSEGGRGRVWRGLRVTSFDAGVVCEEPSRGRTRKEAAEKESRRGSKVKSREALGGQARASPAPEGAGRVASSGGRSYRENLRRESGRMMKREEKRRVREKSKGRGASWLPRRAPESEEKGG